MSGNITVTPGYTFTSNTDPQTLTKLNQLGTPTAQVDAGAITSRELGSSVPLVDASGQAVFYDDFLGDTSANSLIGNTALTTLASGGGSPAVAITASTSGRAGVVLFTGPTSAGYALIRGPSGTGAWVAGAGAITWEWAIKTPSTLADVTNNYELCVGLANGASDATQPTEGVYFYYNYATSSGVWVGRTVTSSTVTAVVSSTTVATSTWYTLKATINALNTSVEFFINGTSIGTSTTNLSAAALTPMCSLKWLAGASRSFNADWVKVVQTITTAR